MVDAWVKTMFAVCVAVAALVFGLGAAAAGAPLTGSRVNVCVAPASFPAHTPFWVGAGIGTSLDNKLVVLDPRTRVELDVDGEKVTMLTDISFSDETANKVNVHNFRFGLAAGTHRFEQRIYLEGVFQFDCVADVSFT